MRIAFLIFGLAAVATPALGQSSNTSSNSSSNNGHVRERVVDSYCDGGYCERSVYRRQYWSDRGDRRWDRRPYRSERQRWRRDRDRDRDDD